MVMQRSELYSQVKKLLMQQEDASTASMMARHLMSHYIGCSHEEFLRDLDMEADAELCRNVVNALQRIMNGEPFAYVLGEWEFYGLNLCITPDVLIPRDDTCAVVSLAIDRAMFLPEAPRILDLCTGSGCIGLAIASRVHDARITLADISQDALNVAKKNITRYHMAGRVTPVRIDAMAAPPGFLGKFDMIVSNPPYVTGQEMGELDDSVKNFEPHLALYGGKDGLDFYRAICRNFTSVLKQDGYLCFEFGMGQGDDVCRILEENGYTILERTRDYNDRERAVLAQYGRRGE